MQFADSAKNFDVAAHYEKHEYRIPMRDGVRLFTAVYTPKDRPKRYPFLLTRTPYGIAPYGAEKYPKRLGPSANFAREGFIFVYQDVRGRNMSEGTWVEMRPENARPGSNDVDESTDTYDTIEWLLHNVPDNNGRAGLLGVSYPGFYASAGLIRSHPALLAVSPQAPISDLYMGDDAFHNGAFFLLANFSFYSEFNKQANPTSSDDEKAFPYGTNDGYKFYLSMGPLANSDEFYFRYRNPYWTDVLRHPNYDEFWRERNILPHLRDVKPAVLVVGGWFDAEDLSGTLNTYRAIAEQSPGTSNKLVMGPWVHGGWQFTDGDKLGDISFGAKTSDYFQDQIELPFFRQHLKDAPDPQLATATVFETGKNRWRHEPQWPPADAHSERLYLQSGERLIAANPGDESGFDEYVSDPDNPVPFFSKPALTMATAYMNADQRFVQGRRDVLTYQTDVLSEDFTVAGPVSPTLFVSSSGTDSDFVVKLIDVYPESAGGGLSGYQQLVRGEPFRAKFRHGFERPEPLEPGRIKKIEFSMPDVFHCFEKRHRLMVQIQSSWFPLVDRNPQTFVDIPKAKKADFVKATERVYRQASAASSIEFRAERGR